MRRQTSYPAELPLATDFLLAEQNIMVAIGELIQSLCGSSTFVTGLSCTPTSPTASLQVVLGAGCVYQSEPIEATTWSALNANTANNIMKQGIALNAQTLPTFTPPSTSGFSQDFLVEVQYQDSDITALVLPNLNPDILLVPESANWAGPGNSGASQNTQRDGILAVQVKAGVAAATGTQVPPTADTGWAGLYVLTLANGQTQITSGSIALATNAPFLTTTLNNVAGYIQSGAAVACADTGAANALAVAPIPAPAAITAGMALKVKVGHALTGASTLAVMLASGSAQTNAITRADASATQAGDLIAGQEVELTFDDTEWQIPRAVSTGTRTPVSDANYTALTTDRNIAYTAITAARVLSLPAAASFPTGVDLAIFDESGNCSTTNTIAVTPNAQTVAAGGSWTTSSTSITLAATLPSWVVAGMNVYDSTNGQQIGLVGTGSSGTTLNLAAAAAHASSGSSDSLLIGDLVDGKTSRVLQAAYAFLTLQSNGSSKWTVKSHDIASWIAGLPTSLPGTTHTPWNDGGVLSTT